MQALVAFWNDRTGSSAAEYSLILGTIGAAIALAAYVLGIAVGNSINEAADCLDNQLTC